jgi:hypothetical protein
LRSGDYEEVSTKEVASYWNICLLLLGLRATKIIILPKYGITHHYLIGKDVFRSCCIVSSIEEEYFTNKLF